MKFKYPPMETHNFNNMRLYLAPNGQYYPSITTVLGHTISDEKSESLKSWQRSLGEEQAAKVTNDAAERGSGMHLLIERHLKGEDLYQGDQFTKEQLELFNCLKVKLRRITNIWGQEVALYSDSLGIAGRCDLVGEWEGTPAIVDFKSSTRLKSQKDVEDYRYQLRGYADMHNEMFGTNIQKGIILMGSAGGFPQEFKVDLQSYEVPLKARIRQFYATVSFEPM